MKVEGSLQVLRPGQGALGSDAVGGLTFAEASGTPAFEGRLRLTKAKLLDVYIVGHWNRIDRDGVDNGKAIPPALRGESQDIIVGSTGVKVTVGPLTVQGQGYVGKNLAEFTTSLGQFVRTQDGDLHEWGAWGQAGYNITPEFSAWAFLGTCHPNYKEVEDLANAGAFSTLTAATNPTPAQILANSRGNAKLQNVTTAAMLRYMEGGYALALEYVHMRTKYLVPQGTSAVRSSDGVLNGNQLMFSGMYFF
jgi:hypothetical protein